MSICHTDAVTPNYPRLVWRIGVAMAEAGIRTNRDLKKRLASTGYKTSEATLCRLRKTDLRAIDLELLSALCAVLGCTPDTLLAPTGGWSNRLTANSLGGDSAPNSAVAQETIPPRDKTPPPNPASSTMLGPRIRSVTSAERAQK